MKLCIERLTILCVSVCLCKRCTRASPSFSHEIRGIFGLSNEQKQSVHDGLRLHKGDGLTVVGFIVSLDESLIANPNSIQQMLGGIHSLATYLNDTGINEEIEPILNPRLADNMAILGVIQKTVLNGGDRRDALLSKITVEELTSKFTLEESARYVKYALAAYGDTAIQAANKNSHERFDLGLGFWTKSHVAKHIGLPENDIIIMDLKYRGDTKELRHFVAVDHENQKVVLAIRGTFCASECVVDIDGYSRPFCGGQAHAGFAEATERLWKLVADDVLKALKDNNGYELIITGHSLGAGVSLLLNILLHQDERMENRPFRTFAYASPPAFEPLSLVPKALQTAVNYMHDNDDVPLLSGDSIRHQVACLAAIDKHCKEIPIEDKGKLVLGETKPSASLIRDANKAFQKKLPEKQGMPVLMAPAIGVVWASEIGNSDVWDVKICDPEKLAHSEIWMDASSPLDHYPTRYECAFTNIGESITNNTCSSTS